MARFSVALAILTLGCMAGVAETLGAQSLTVQQQLALDIYKELVEINTVTESGDTRRAADAMAARLRAAGFDSGDVQVFKPAPRKGNLVARLRAVAHASPSCCLLISTWLRRDLRIGRSVLVKAFFDGQEYLSRLVARLSGAK